MRRVCGGEGGGRVGWGGVDGGEGRQGEGGRQLLCRQGGGTKVTGRAAALPHWGTAKVMLRRRACRGEGDPDHAGCKD